MMTKTRYIGDARIQKLLDRYACPAPFHVVRAMMMGDIASPLMGSPTQTIQSLWNGELPEFETTEEAEAFFGGLLGLWNHLGRHQKRSQPFKLVAGGIPSDRDGMAAYCRMRFEEVIAMLEGFFQGEDEIDLPSELGECVHYLEGTAEIFGSAMGTLADESVPWDDEAAVGLRKNLDEVLKIANKEAAQLVWLAADDRKRRLAATRSDVH